MPITQTAAWQALEQHRRDTASLTISQRFAAEPDRFERMHGQLHGLLVDYSKNRIGEDTLQLLCALAETARLPEKMQAMRRGDAVNASENRAALHTALRLPADAAPVYVHGENVLPAMHGELARALAFADSLNDGSYANSDGLPFTDLVNIGIGGSDLGARTAVEALAPYHGRLRVHFAANIDGAELASVLERCTPAQTLFVVASKSFTTPETLLNARAARAWLLDNGIGEAALPRHFAAVSANAEAVRAFGIAEENRFAMSDWVGGRYSVWSPVGLPLMAAVGAQNFRDFLAGAHAVDEHFFNTPLRRNIPVLLGLISLWYNNFHGAQTHAVIPYTHLLRSLPAHLQQLDMESNGKHTLSDGRPARCDTGSIIWGSEGVNCQHAYFQLLHQGTRLIPVDFIVPADTPYPQENRAFAAANAFAQAEALMAGKSSGEPHRSFEGNRPSNTLLAERLDPFTLGMLIALYEHRVFVQAAVWDINPFDQWGVEYGKVLAKTILAELENGVPAAHDASTAALIARFKQQAV
ncbi:glucose-6-phosphate isomerase [Neisseria sp. oral taxon 020 str. F0370]|uniref:glucose-6-phosphate isomerase n=1 Tax=unclassified Neisseria TaxID=2623750 RepID=UPI0002A458F0|nr:MULTISPECIES: glucose-6-phosphate isomerase [unclassified Neisseria]ASP16333.1 glucose-6-phosphate isomerase [Neisseria sp. KEM232]EKY03534.1 glucose-6-phosphate isomerase [Neisseria sp. oral taxon 020 str. F0370]